MKTIPYIMLKGSLSYAILYARPSIYFVMGMVSKYQLNPRSLNLVGVKHILKYLRRMRDYMLILQNEDFLVAGFTNIDL